MVALAGIGLALMTYAGERAAADPVTRIPGYAFFANLWGMDAFWNTVGARLTLAVGRFVALFDRNVIDRYIANGPGWLCAKELVVAISNAMMQRAIVWQVNLFMCECLCKKVVH